MKFFGFMFFLVFILSCSDKISENSEKCKKDEECEKGYICMAETCISDSFLCQNKKCSGHGTCKVKDSKAVCICEEGYVSSGLSCKKAPCIKNGDCEKNKVCFEGECKDENILCENVNCENGRCIVKDKKAYCDCDEGYIEKDLKCVWDKCKDIECLPGEICNWDTGICEEVANPCEGIDCGEHGECNYDREGNIFCDCEEDYSDKGLKCVFDIKCVKTSDSEICNNGVDDNCDGNIDEGCLCQSGDSLECYSSDVSRVGKGICKKGIMYCIGGESWSSCEEEVLPVEEICDGLDNDCDGYVDNFTDGNPLTEKCYSGNPEEILYPDSRCKEGVYVCKNGSFDTSECIGEVLPLDEEICGNGIDDNCNGVIDEECHAPIVVCSEDVARAYIFESPVYLYAEADDEGGTIATKEWSFISKPEGSASELRITTGNRTDFIPDTVGEYIVRFTATDNDGEKSFCDIKVNAKTRNHLNVTLTWDKGGRSDMDLHLLRPGAMSNDWNTYNDCFWAIPNPDWGERGLEEDNPSLDRDDTDGYGPEVIQIERPEDGVYTVGVDYFDAQNQGASIARVKVICNGEEFTYTSLPMNAKDKWSVVDIVWQDDNCILREAEREFR